MNKILLMVGFPYTCEQSYERMYKENLQATEFHKKYGRFPKRKKRTKNKTIEVLTELVSSNTVILGIFQSVEEIEKIIFKENNGIDECGYYQWIVVEEHTVGCLSPCSREVEWYCYDSEEHRYKKMERPECLTGIVSFA